MSDKYIISIDTYERGIIINILNEKRNEILHNFGDTEIVDDVLMKLIDCEPAKVKEHEQR